MAIISDIFSFPFIGFENYSCQYNNITKSLANYFLLQQISSFKVGLIDRVQTPGLCFLQVSPLAPASPCPPPLQKVVLNHQNQNHNVVFSPLLLAVCPTSPLTSSPQSYQKPPEM